MQLKVIRFMDEIKKLLMEENKLDPLTDDAIADMLKINRAIVTAYRIKNGIPNSRERKHKSLVADSEKIIKNETVISDRKLSKALKKLGYDVSKYTANKLIKEIKKEAAQVKKAENSKKEAEDPFDNVIGRDKSLKVEIDKAQAAILYPPHGLHTLILGPSGTGKSFLVDAMHKFALTTNNFKKDAPLIKFNCADYADNPQLLLSQLFGYCKGAFTGADSEKAGLVEKASGGILFLDEVHNLPSEGQEILFSLLDHNSFRRLGETENLRKSDIMLIMATTKDPESSLLLTFRRRIPMLIKLPALRHRTFEERFDLIHNCFRAEAFKIGKPIIIEAQVIKYLLLYKCPGNIGQLKSDIQVLCAKALLNLLQHKYEAVKIDSMILPNNIINELDNVEAASEAKKFYENDLIVYPSYEFKMQDFNNDYNKANDLYQFIEKRFGQLKKQNIDKDEIGRIISKEIEEQLNKFVNHNKLFSENDLNEIVGKEIVDIAYDSMKIIKKYYSSISDNFFYSFTIHIKTVYDRIKSGKKVLNLELQNVAKQYPQEFKVANLICSEVGKKLNINFPSDEVGVIAMYLKVFNNTLSENIIRSAVIIITHGDAAVAIADVANKILGVDYAVGIKMDLDESPETVLERTISTIQGINGCSQCLLLVDMGSLLHFDKSIKERLGMPVRAVGRVDTIMVLEAIRKSMLPNADVYKIADELGREKLSEYLVCPDYNSNTCNSRVIVSLCLTGEGTALNLKKYIEDKIKNIEVIAMGIIDKEDIDKRIKEIRKTKDIIAFVGTVNPDVEGIPFIPTQEIFRNIGINKINILMNNKEEKIGHIKDIINDELIITDEQSINKDQIIDKMANLLLEKGYTTEGFLLSIYKRECLATTIMKGGIAIPHGDPAFVKKNTICIVKLSSPILWADNIYTNFIILFVFKEDAKQYFKELCALLLNTGLIDSLKNAQNADEIKNILLNLNPMN